MAITAITMVVEIVTGSLFGSMALLADGWHMFTHVAAFAITVFAYRYARRHASDPFYTFGTGKVEVLAGFASAVALGVVAVLMIVESLERLFAPHAIFFNQAIAVAVLGLVVNLASALILDRHGGHGHGHAHGHSHHEHHHDLNLKAAYIHVLADALTSVLAIVALACGKVLGWIWMDALMGCVGALVISRWAWELIRDSSAILLDASAGDGVRREITARIENDSDNRVCDLHVWRLSSGHLSASIALVTHHPKPPAHYKALLAGVPQLSHVVMEVNPCRGEPCMEPDDARALHPALA
ncbi:CDF family Co(II)/Ni(II) efflux transporter DmeF [Synechococcus sp. RSCCF101]|uniref:CDF family Co(II)/Ni(II) efflux transporter DmeF n=1 Tax=Synechococcus sp. RSCCF101 TaxID=2511069 RepID=UPI00351A16C2